MFLLQAFLFAQSPFLPLGFGAEQILGAPAFGLPITDQVK
jgi:hypothetical protein